MTTKTAPINTTTTTATPVITEKITPMTKEELEQHGYIPVQAKSWLEVFDENYNGRSEEAKSLQKHLKHNFKGNPYLPWAVMERLTYMQDPNAEFTKDLAIITNALTINTVVKGEITQIDVFAHFVKVTLTFLGKTFDEIYPIQDNEYKAPKAYDQNMVNKAYQRAIAKVASRATGLGLMLYENMELQFEEVAVVVKPELPKVEEKLVVAPVEPSLVTPVKRGKSATQRQMTEPLVTPIMAEPLAQGQAFEEPKPTVIIDAEPVSEPVVEPIVEPIISEPTGEEDAVKAIVELLKNPMYEVGINAILRSFNPAFVKQYGYTISTTESNEALYEKLSKLPDPKKFLANLERIKG